MRNDISILKDEYSKLQNHVRSDLNQMEQAHDAVCNKLAREFTSSTTSFLSPSSSQLGRPSESLSTTYSQEWSASPVEHQEKAQQVKSNVGDMLKRVSENTRRIERERHQYTAEMKTIERPTCFSPPPTPTPKSPGSRRSGQSRGSGGNIGVLGAGADENRFINSPHGGTPQAPAVAKQLFHHKGKHFRL